MIKTLIWTAVLIIIIGGGYLYTQRSESDRAMMASSMGTYEYVCDNGSRFTMTPSDDVSEVQLTAGSQGMFTGTIRLARMGDGNHFETTEGPLVVFWGAGEEVGLEVGSESATCNPVPNSEMAPWNWGDAGEGGGIQPDVSLVVTESIQGKWQSLDDAKFTREFRSDFTVVDSYDGKANLDGLWVVFTKMNAPEISFPLEESAVYLQITEKGTPQDTLTFKVVKLTPDELELIYMDRGGVLRFKSVK
jgi:hypothetical protein